MSVHYSLITRAVAELAENTSETRRALYDRARTDLIKDLEGCDPPLAESEIRRQRLAFEWAIREVEADQASLATLRGAFGSVAPARAPKAEDAPPVSTVGDQPLKSDAVPQAAEQKLAPAGLAENGAAISQTAQPERTSPRKGESEAFLRKLENMLKDLDLKRPSVRAEKAAPQQAKLTSPASVPANEVVKQLGALLPATEPKREPAQVTEVSPPAPKPERTSPKSLVDRPVKSRDVVPQASEPQREAAGVVEKDPPRVPKAERTPTSVVGDQPVAHLGAVPQATEPQREAARVTEEDRPPAPNPELTPPTIVVADQPVANLGAVPQVREPQREAARVTEEDRPPAPKPEFTPPTSVVADQPLRNLDAVPQPPKPRRAARVSRNGGPPIAPVADQGHVKPSDARPDPAADTPRPAIEPRAPEMVEAGTHSNAAAPHASPQLPATVPASAPENIGSPRALTVTQAPGLPDTVPEQQDGPAGHRIHPRLRAMIQAGRYHGIELDVTEFRPTPGDREPSAAALSLWAQNAGMWSRAMRIRWRHLLKLNDSGPVVLLFTDGSAGLLTGANAAQSVVFLKDPFAPADAAPVPVDELRLSEVWAGEAVLLRASRGYTVADAPFSLRWLTELVLQERRSLRDIALGSFTISFLTIFPPLVVMTMVNKVLQFHSISTLLLLSVMMVVVVAYEALLGHARRLIISVIGARLDAKLNLHIFNRLLRLPLDYFERHPAGETMYKIAQIYRVREFLTGRLMTTLLDLITLCVLLPFLFYLNATLAWFVVGCAVVIALIILAFLKPLREMYGRVAAAETWKSAALGETIAGIKTVKALALEPQRRALWDERIAEAGKWRLEFGRLANWPQTLVTPIERFMVIGTMMLGAYMAMNDTSGYLVGGLFAFFMLSQRVAQPLVGLARLVEDYEEAVAAIGEAGSVLNRPLEAAAGAVGLRPKFVGEINFQDVTFTYTGTTVPALDRVTFSVPAGSMLGIVGRSGSGKSTITRLLQGINRDYRGFVKIDGSDLREIDLRHLRQNLGVVLQSNFLFRGSIRDNIIAGRPGLTLADAVHAARLAGAEEFIERMPNGYETYIEEGSPNLSGGQSQRLAIARALIHDPRILILDEATSALDPESEAVVNANLMRIARGRTIVLVSHRLSSLVECDQILVMEQGKVVDVAPHKVLLERCAVFRQLWAQQNRHSESQGPRQAAVAPRLVPGA